MVYVLVVSVWLVFVVSLLGQSLVRVQGQDEDIDPCLDNINRGNERRSVAHEFDPNDQTTIELCDAAIDEGIYNYIYSYRYNMKL